MSWEENINTIKEIYPGYYQIILDFATNAFLKYVLNDSYKYVWVSQHTPTHSLEWANYELPLIDNQNSYAVLARKLSFDFVMETKAFKEIYLKLPPGITVIQLNKLPDYYIDSARIKGKTFYDLLLKECDYLYELDIPSATDYGTLISSDREWLQSLLTNGNIDWDNLP